MFLAAPTNLFVGAALITSRPYKSICRGGCSTSRPYSTFSRKKIKFSIQNHFAERPTTNVPNSVRVAECPATNVPNRVRVAERPTTSVHVVEHPATTTKAQEYSINYNYKSNLEKYIQSIIKYTNFIHILINVLGLAFQSHECVGTEDFYLSSWMC